MILVWLISNLMNQILIQTKQPATKAGVREILREHLIAQYFLVFFLQSNLINFEGLPLQYWSMPHL